MRYEIGFYRYGHWTRTGGTNNELEAKILLSELEGLDAAPKVKDSETGEEHGLAWTDDLTEEQLLQWAYDELRRAP